MSNMKSETEGNMISGVNGIVENCEAVAKEPKATKTSAKGLGYTVFVVKMQLTRCTSPYSCADRLKGFGLNVSQS